MNEQMVCSPSPPESSPIFKCHFKTGMRIVTCIISPSTPNASIIVTANCLGPLALNCFDFTIPVSVTMHFQSPLLNLPNTLSPRPPSSMYAVWKASALSLSSDFSSPLIMMVLHLSKILSGAPFITSRRRLSLGSSVSWIESCAP